MKLIQTKQAIEAYADGLRAASADSAADGLRVVASFVGEFPDVQMSVFIERGSKADRQRAAGATSAGASPNVSLVVLQLDHLVKILSTARAKAEVTKDLASLSKLLRGFAESETLSAEPLA